MKTAVAIALLTVFAGKVGGLETGWVGIDGNAAFGPEFLRGMEEANVGNDRIAKLE